MAVVGIGLGGLTGCSGSTATPEDLARTVVAYLSANDFDGYLANTVMTTDQGFELCPAADKIQIDVPDFRDEFQDCLKAFDFSSASVVSVDAKLETFGVGFKECGNKEPLNTAERVEIKVANDKGTYSFKMRDIFETSAGWRQTEDMSCGSVVAEESPPSGP